MADVRIPNEEEISRLPRWAQVAFAARCARRVQPLFKHFWPDAPKEHLDAVDTAVRLAEDCASTASLTDATIANAANAANAAANAAEVAKAAHVTANPAYFATANTAYPTEAANAAYFAANAAANAAYLTDAADAAAKAAANAAYFAADAASGRAAIAEMRADIESLLAAAKTERWDKQWYNDTPVPPEFFGSMWPNGTPDGWPAQADDGEISGPISFYIDPSAYSPEEAGELLAVLSDIYESLSNDRLVIDGTGQAEVLVDEPVLPAGGS